MRRKAAGSLACPPVFFSSDCVDSIVHLRGGIGFGCGEKVTRSILENPRSGVHSAQISQAGAGDSVWAAQTCQTTKHKRTNRAGQRGRATVRMAHSLRRESNGRSASVYNSGAMVEGHETNSVGFTGLVGSASDHDL